MYAAMTSYCGNAISSGRSGNVDIHVDPIEGIDGWFNVTYVGTSAYEIAYVAFAMFDDLPSIDVDNVDWWVAPTHTFTR